VGKDPIAGGKKSYGGNPPVIRNKDGVLQNRGEYGEDGVMIKGQPMTHDEFMNGCPGDELIKVFENGAILVEQKFADVMGRAKVTNLYPEMRQAVDNLESKMDFFHKMTSDEAIAMRLAEASCGSKWSQAHDTTLAEMKEKYPKYAPAMDTLGLTDAMKASEVVNHIKSNHVCEKKAKSKIFRALSDDDPAAATAAMGGKFTVTL